MKSRDLVFSSTTPNTPMRFELQKLDAGQVCVPISILENDLDEMWNRFDSGMCDLTTANAVAIAINRTLKAETTVRVVTDGTSEDFHVVFHDQVFPLPVEISVWLNRCLRGLREKPIVFSIWVPRDLAAECSGITFPAENAEESIAA